MTQDIKHRCYYFSIKLVKSFKSIQFSGLEYIVVKQVVRSGMSIGANVVEAKNSSSRKEFKRYYEIALKSSNETKYWLSILKDGFEVDEIIINELLEECIQISKILASSILTLKQNQNDK